MIKFENLSETKLVDIYRITDFTGGCIFMDEAQFHGMCHSRKIVN